MKKNLLTLASAIAFAASSAFAFVPQQGPVATGNETGINGARAATADGYEINFAGSPYTAYTLSDQNNATYRCYLYITPEVATQLAGNQLTKISMAPAILASNTLSGYIFVSEDIDADPLTSTNVTFTNGYNSQTGNFSYQTHSLETSYEIKENTGFYFGYVMNNVKRGTNSDYVVGIDNQAPNPFSGYADVIKNGEVISSCNVGADLGANLLLKATTVGDKKDLSNMVTVSSASIGDFTLPITNQLTDAKATVVVTNLGSNKINSINYTVSVEGGESITANRILSLASFETATISNLTLPTLIAGRGKVTFTLNKLNGKDIDPISRSFKYLGIDGEGYARKFVVEEGTGTWCGWCPRGIVGFDYMTTTYPDDFIGIAAHYGDEMQVESYNPLFYYYISGFPGAMINRDPGYIIDPSASELTSCYNIWKDQKSIASVSLEAGNPTDGIINVTATTTFAIDDPAANYSLAFVTLEDGIIGMQSNYYAGGSYGTMGGWEKKGSSVRTSYKHVARNIFDFFGIMGSIPAQVTKGDAVIFNYDLSLDNVSDVDKSSIVALLYDNASGTILNAAQIHADQYGTSGMSAITEDSNAPVEYYNLQGIRMSGDNLPAGIYVTRQGNKTAKVIVK